jgi:aminoglycoside phosphotransferase (APT) family kinase protein
VRTWGYKFVKARKMKITAILAKKLIKNQFPEYASLEIYPEKQGHDNRTYRLGQEMLICMPTADPYALKVNIEHKLLLKLAPYLSVKIPTLIQMDQPSNECPYPFSIYKWIVGKNANQFIIDNKTLESLAIQLAIFLRQLQDIYTVQGPCLGCHNWWWELILIFTLKILNNNFLKLLIL